MEELANQVHGSCCPRGALGLLASLSRSSGLLGIPYDCIAAPHLHATAQPWHNQRNTPSAGRFKNHATSLGALGSSTFVEGQFLLICDRSQLATGQICSIAVRDSGLSFVAASARHGRSPVFCTENDPVRYSLFAKNATNASFARRVSEQSKHTGHCCWALC